MRPVLIGVCVGLGLALLGSQAIAAALYAGVSPRDPLAFALAACVLVVAASVGVWIPARRAAKVDPAMSLRAE
jgi:ABC-type antimicrobial peptide transport system permease subunit